MYYYYYKQYFKKDILVYVEEVNREDNSLIIDFLDSNELSSFNEILNSQFDIEKASMIKIINYKQKSVRANTVYSIDRKRIERLRDSNNIEEINDSFLFSYSINLKNEQDSLFKTSVTIGELDRFNIGAIVNGNAIDDILNVNLKGKISVNVRNVGQGNWNEIIENKIVKIVYDAGAPMNSPKSKVREYIDTKPNEYAKNKPLLFLSHWDKDHYHSLVGMTDQELKCFSGFICPDIRPNITSRILYGRIERAIGINNIYTVSNIPKVRGAPPTLSLLSQVGNNLMVFNSTENKDRNQSGIVLSINTINSSIILPADCHYELLSNSILPLLNHNHSHNLIVPHHGGNAGSYIYNLMPGVTANIAAISVGNNRYGHPKLGYTRALTLDWFIVQNTKVLISDILINL